MCIYVFMCMCAKQINKLTGIADTKDHKYGWNNVLNLAEDEPCNVTTLSGLSGLSGLF